MPDPKYPLLSLWTEILNSRDAAIFMAFIMALIIIATAIVIVGRGFTLEKGIFLIVPAFFFVALIDVARKRKRDPLGIRKKQ